MQYVDFLLQCDERGVRVYAVFASTPKLRADHIRKAARERALQPLTGLGRAIQQALHLRGYAPDADYDAPRQLELGERVSFSAHDCDNGPTLILELPAALSAADEADLIDASRVWLMSVGLSNVQVSINGAADD